jgi:hypothetical protein
MSEIAQYNFCNIPYSFFQEIVDLVDSVSSSNKLDTPSSKSGTKRSSGGIDSAGLDGLEHGERSINKPTKMVRVKVEPPENK